jgi:pimeloyl-ACP methyl ester carboxylesterase
MNGELTFTMTADHVRLHGFYSAASGPTEKIVGDCDAAVLIHGLGSNFYSARVLNYFAKVLQSMGVSTVLVNTRGHDMINTSTWGVGSRSVGAAFENVGDCVHDVSGWVDFLKNKGHRNVLLLGHSLGAIKSLYSQAHQPHPDVQAIVGLSATRLSYQRAINSPNGGLFRETIQRCQQLIAAGQGDAPIHVPFPFPTWMTPNCYFAKYGPEETYNWLKFVDRIETPTLLLFGSRELESNASFEGLRDEIGAIATSLYSVTFDEIEGADHFYSGKFPAAESRVRQWLASGF